FTRTYMSTLYKRHIYRKTCKNWKTLQNNYDKIKRYDLLISQGKPNQAEDYKKKHMVDYTALFRYATDKDSAQYSDKRMSVIRKDYDTIHRSLFKKHEFYLKTDNNVKATEMFLSQPEFDRHRTDKRYKIEELKEATFSQELIKIMVKIFQEEIEYFQRIEVEETTTILDQIDRYNEKAERNKKNYIKLYGKEK